MISRRYPASYKEGSLGLTMSQASLWRHGSITNALDQEQRMLQKPIIQPNYLSHDEDRRVLLAGIKISQAFDELVWQHILTMKFTQGIM